MRRRQYKLGHTKQNPSDGGLWDVSPPGVGSFLYHAFLYVGVVECTPASLSPASSSLTHTRRMDCFCNQNADQLGFLAGLSFPAVYVGVVECAPAFLSPASSSLTHTRRMDGFCNQNADQHGSLAGLSFPVVYVGVVEYTPACLSPTSSSLTHKRRMDGFCNQNPDQLGSLAGLSFSVVYVGVVECATASLLYGSEDNDTELGIVVASQANSGDDTESCGDVDSLGSLRTGSPALLGLAAGLA